MALTIVLTAAGALFVGALRQLEAEPLGFSVDRVLGARLSALPGGYGSGFSGNPYYRTLLDRVDALPGVAATSLSHDAIMTGSSAVSRVGIAHSHVEIASEQAFVTDSFFSTMEIPLVGGVSFGRLDTATGIRTAIVSASVARAMFGSSGAVGRTIRVGASPLNQSLQVVGVAKDAAISSIQKRNSRIVYLNFWQVGPTMQSYPMLLVRTRGEPGQIADALQRTVSEGGREYVSQVRTLSEQRNVALMQERLLATLSTAFGMLGLTIAAVGLYGLLTFSVAQRAGEIGLRIALGATRRDVSSLVLRQAAMLLVVGVAIGAPAAWTAGKAAAAFLFGGVAILAAPIATAVALMMAVGALAVWIPARRASSVDPIQALRRE